MPSMPCRLYLLEAKGGIHELAGHMQALTRALEALKSTFCSRICGFVGAHVELLRSVWHRLPHPLPVAASC